MMSAQAKKRREELRDALRRIVALAREREVDALTIGGDLYEHDRVTDDTGHFLARQFEEFGKPVLIAPGNHDPYLPGSLYRRIAWPDNVHIFGSDGWQRVEAGGVAVWGIGHNAPDVHDNYLRDLRLNGDETSVVLLHGSDMSAVPEGKTAHCPFDVEDVAGCGAAFVLLGHYHGLRLRPEGAARYGYPGSPEPLGFDEEGAHYVLLLTVNGGRATAEALPINDVHYRTERIDVGSMVTSDQVREAIEQRAGDGGAASDIVRVVLEGEAAPELNIDPEALLLTSAERFRYLDLVDDTDPAFDPDEISEERTTRGAFVQLMRQRMEEAAPEERGTLERALVYGLQAFAGREVRPR